MIAVLDEVSGLIDATGSEIDRHHGVDAGLLCPGREFVGSELIRLGREPGEVELARPGFLRTDAVFPVVARDEVPARISNRRGAQLTHELEHIRPKAARVRHRVTGLIDAAVNRTPEMLDERAVQTW